jgi:exodeoxyribonuclease VII small subunit
MWKTLPEPPGFQLDFHATSDMLGSFSSGHSGEHMDEPLSYESALEKLETIVRRLESDATSLDDSLKLFEEGVRLGRFCSQKLDEAEKKVLMLVESSEGSDDDALEELESELP